jgi:hypothetical protein
VNTELETMWKETSVASFEVQLTHLPEKTEEMHETLQTGWPNSGYFENNTKVNEQCMIFFE